MTHEIDLAEPTDLRPSNPGNSSEPKATVSNTPTSFSILTVPVMDIEPYDKNPRRMKHPKYEVIKESIFHDGLNQPFVITRKPGNKKFMIFKGGNTRLNIVRELYEETGDRRFKFINCSFQPWTGNEVDAIIGHLKENEMRNSLCFIDRAHGIKLAIEFLKKQSNEKLSLRTCLKLLIENGFSTSLSTLSIMLYATDFVEPWLAKEVCRNMGRPQMQKIRSLDNAFKKLCHEFNTPQEIYSELFRKTLQSYKEPEWSIQLFRRTLESAVAEIHTVSIQNISLRLDGYLHHSLALTVESVKKSFVKRNSTDDTIRSEYVTNIVKHPPVYSVNTTTSGKNSHLIGEIKFSNEKSPFTMSKRSLSNSSPKNTTRYSSTPNSPSSEEFSENFELYKKINVLRSEAHRLAWCLAKQYDIHQSPDTKQKIIHETVDWGLGYLVTDYPSNSKLLSLNDASLREALWWILVELSDLTWAVECARPMVAKLIGNSEFRHFVKSGNSATLCLHAKSRMKCAYPHLGLFAFCLRQLDDHCVQFLNQLNFTYRALHKIARASNIHLFKTM